MCPGLLVVRICYTFLQQMVICGNFAFPTLPRLVHLGETLGFFPLSETGLFWFGNMFKDKNKTSWGLIWLIQVNLVNCILGIEELDVTYNEDIILKW